MNLYMCHCSCRVSLCRSVRDGKAVRVCCISVCARARARVRVCVCVCETGSVCLSTTKVNYMS